MIRLPRKVAYIFEAIVEIAQSTGEGPLPSRALADRQRIPARYLEQALQRLVRVGILEGIRGPRGGYLLARSPSKIDLREVVEAVLEDDHMGSGQGYESKSDLGAKVIQPLFNDLERDLMRKLDGLTIADLLERAETTGSISGHREALAARKAVQTADIGLVRLG